MEQVKDKRYYLGDDFAIDVISNPDGTIMNKPGMLFLSGEKEITSKDEKIAGHDVYAGYEFEDTENLRQAQLGLEIIQKSIHSDEDLKEEMKR